MTKSKPAELKPVPRKGAEHWGRVHIEGDRRRPLDEPLYPETRRKR